MKTLLATTAFILTSALMPIKALAEVPSREAIQIARILINSPEIVTQLKANFSDHLAKIEIKEQERHVIRYHLRFVRQCECIPSTAEVTIIEDLRPTEVDGPAKYSSSIKITSGR